jgi:probable HAF family extracellular repeat protein
MKAATLVCTLVLSACFTAFAQTSYTFTDLGAMPTNGFSQARAINATGEITGSAGQGNLSQTFSYANGAMTGLGTLGGKSGIGNGINASGQIAGYSENAKETYRAFVATGGILTDIGDLGGGSAVAYAINDAGQVVGSAVTADGSNHPFLYSNGTMTDLGTLGSPNGNGWWNVAQSINDSGQIAGTSYNAQGNFLGFVWSKGRMTAMGTLGGLWSQAYAINNKGQVTGLAYTKSGLAHAFVANCATCKLKDIEAPNSTMTTWGFGINDSGVVVGQATFGNTYHAFIYSGGKLQDLNKMIPTGTGWVLIEADAINNAGQIVGMAMRANGEEHAFLLTPSTTASAGQQ